jgi:hypothetical protein
MLYVISFFFLPKANSPSGTKKTKREEKGVTSTKGGMNGVQVTGTLFRLVFCFPSF